jgi:L-galactose dehydrogenase/L-glyceraldehyde 3-phosphate reductase
MRYRRLGNTGITVSEIGFGCGPTAGLMIYGTRAEQQAAVQQATGLGITYFDTAPIYGDYVSEDNLGRALADARLRPVIATKVALETPDLVDIPAAVRRSLDDSLRRLRVPDVAVVQLHNRIAPMRADRSDLGVGAVLTVQDVLGPVLETFRALRSEGKVQALGCCAFGGDPASVREVIASGAFDTVLVSYSLLNPTSGRAPPAGFAGRDFGNVIDAAAAHGMSAIVLRVLAGGALSGASAPHPTSSRARQETTGFGDDAVRARALQFLVRPDQTLVQAAIRFALQHPRVGVVLVGISAPDQLAEAAAAASGDGLSVAELARLEGLYARDFDVEPVQASANSS